MNATSEYLNKPVLRTEQEAVLSARFAKPYCFYVHPTQEPTSEGYIPSIVFEGESGHYPMIGNGSHATPWYFGKTLDEAEARCTEENAKRGVSESEATRIITSSMFPMSHGRMR